MRALLLLGLGFVMSSQLFAQQNRLKYAEKLYSGGVYADAAEAYEDVLERGVDSVKISDHITESYDQSGNQNKALEWYGYKKRNNTLTREDFMRYSLLLGTKGKYLEAREVLEQSLTKYGKDSLTVYRLGELDKFMKSAKEKPNFEIRTQKGNSEYAEMSVIPVSDKQVIFASTRDQRVAVRRYHALNNKPLYDLFIANCSDEGFSKVKRFDENTRYHDASGTMDTVHGRFYFTRNNFDDGRGKNDSTGNMRLKVYVGEWYKGKIVNTHECSFNSDEYSCAHPSVSADGTTLYFSSDMPGSYGGMDIYQVSIDSLGNYGKPKNMGPLVNTLMDELFPFYHSKNKLLFFASNGHYGFGGLDVFVSRLNKSGEVKDLTNAGEPLNSTADDFGFLNDVEQKKGYFSTNREGGTGDDDICAFKQFKPYGAKTVSGYVIDQLRRDTIPDAVLVLRDENQQPIDTVKADQHGFYSFDVSSSDEQMDLHAEKQRFEDAEQVLSWKNNEADLKQDVEMIPILKYYVVGTIRDKDTRNVLSNVTVKVTNLRTAKDMMTLKTDDQGYFETDTIEEFHYGDPFGISLLLEKSGYLTTTFVLYDTLDLVERIDVNAFIDPVMGKVTVGTDLAKLIDLNSIYYDYMKWSIRPDAAKELDKIVKVMQDNPKIKIELGSHTDTRGSAEKNLILSEKRAKSAVDYIISKGIASNRIKAKGYGESKPLMQDAAISKLKGADFEKAHQLNRRTEFRVTEM
ncbi:OmpA family protein [Fluviicola sp.]|uniref:OmpA family protein n=1 Tax=Fluviicola sp. TaxID=1917219 RepID=UPI003D291F16